MFPALAAFMAQITGNSKITMDKAEDLKDVPFLASLF